MSKPVAERWRVKLQKAHDEGWEQGYVCAVSNIIKTHGADVIAKDVLRGVTPVNWSIIDAYDRDALAKAGLAPRRRKPRKGKTVQ